ncbi:MAG: glycosyltransferase [Eubacteriales bacterium]
MVEENGKTEIVDEPKEQAVEESDEVKALDEDEIQRRAIKLGWMEEQPEAILTGFDPMLGIKTLDDNPMDGIKTLDDDSMNGIKTLDDDPMDGIKTLDDDPMSGINTLDDDPMEGIKTLDDDPMDGIKTLDDDFDIFAVETETDDSEYIDPDAEEEISESEYKTLIAAQKRQQKQQAKEDKLKRAEERKEKRAEKRALAAERKKQKKEEARQKKLYKENFGKLKRPIINPSVTVLVPTYNPQRKVFIEQLRSIDAQSYDNISILILDDASEVLDREDLLGVALRVVTNVEVRVEVNEKHLGMAKTCEKLVEMAESDLVAFSTQNDDWDKNKILRLVLAMQEDEDAVLAYSDARVINEEGEVLSPSLLGYGLFEEFKSGANIARHFLTSNSIKLETALIKTEKLKNAVPFAPGFEIDHYIAFRMALEGKILFVGRALLDSRIHIKQDAEVFGIRPKTDRESYIEKNINSKIIGLKWIEKEVQLPSEIKEALDEAIIWLMARRENLRGKENFSKELLENKDFGENELKFELKLAKLTDEEFDLACKEHIISLLEPTEEYIRQCKKEERKQKIEKILKSICSKLSKIFAILPKFQKKPKVRKVNAAVKREIERKMKEEMLANESEHESKEGEASDN